MGPRLEPKPLEGAIYAETIPFPMTELPLKFKCANVLNPFSMKQAISELAYVFKFSVL